MTTQDSPEQSGHCERCGARCRVVGPGQPDARLLKYSASGGLCVNCATHDWLRTTPPLNSQIAKQGPRILLHPHVRDLFGQLLRAGNADANLDEINWNLIVENWELPWQKEPDDVQ